MRKSLFVILAVLALFATPVFAQGGPAAAPATNWIAISASFGMAIAVGLAALGQGRVASAVAEALSRNPAARPGIQLTLILGLAFIESLVLFTFVMIFLKAA